MIDNKAVTLTDDEGLDRLVRGYQFTQALHVAVRLGIPDLVADGPRSATDLAAASGAHAPSLARLLRALTTLGVFAEVAPEVFGPTRLAHLLRVGVPGSRRAMLLLVGSELYGGWGHLLHAIRTGESTAGPAYGMDAWAWKAQHPEANAIFNDTMVEQTTGRVAALVAAYDFAPFGTVVDVGGGRGALLAGILRATPGVRGVLFDQAHVVAGADETFAAAGVAERASIATGDFFAAVPARGRRLYPLLDPARLGRQGVAGDPGELPPGDGRAWHPAPLRARAARRRGPPLGTVLQRFEHAPGARRARADRSGVGSTPGGGGLSPDADRADRLRH